MMNFLQKLALVTMLCSCYSTSTRAAESCKQVLSVSDVLRSASRLDGQIVCIRGMVVLTTVPEWGQDAEFFEALAPLPTKSTERTAKTTTKLGLVEWSPETGIGEEHYKPDSFDILSGEGLKSRAHPSRRLDVTVRAAVMYEKHLREKIQPIPANPPAIRALREARYDVELVVLEIPKANKIRGNSKNE